MLDVHVLVHPTTPRGWIEECLASVRAAADNAGYPVAVHVLPAVLGHIGRARMAGYAQGCGEYVTSVDDDDWVEPNAFAALADALATHPALLTTAMYAHVGDRVRRLPWHEALRAFRRDVVADAPLDAWPIHEGPRLRAYAATKGPEVHLDAPLYHYRVHASPHRALAAQLAQVATS